ncbi:MAG: FG-GAP-like repeat-containing protein [Planctomycetota bacterium]|nr:FG-GAP-like repeat-containing protein [Planctomycetota bacterium]
MKPLNTLIFLAILCPLLPAEEAREEPLKSDLPTLTNVTEEVGLKGKAGSFFSWCDFNDDGFVDVYGGQLFQNSGPPKWTFTDVTATVFPQGSPGRGVWADIDNDGRVDLVIPGPDPADETVGGTIMKNEGKGKFTALKIKATAPSKAFKYQVAAGCGDFDRDGFVDICCVGGEDWNDGKPQYFADFLWHNDKGLGFTDVTTKSGAVDARPSYGRGAAWGDYDNDGWPDCYISNYRLAPNFLWRNRHDGTFKDVAIETGCAGTGRDQNGGIPGDIYGHTIGLAWADLDNDGDLDLIAANLVHKDGKHGYHRGLFCDDSKVYRNNGAPDYRFEDVRVSAGIPLVPLDTVGTNAKGEGNIIDELWAGVVCGDFDNDGLVDFFAPQVYDLPWARGLFYRNKGAWTFDEIGQKLGITVVDTYTGSFADYNNDGQLDLLTAGRPDPTKPHEIMLLRNSGTKNAWLEVRLKAKESNRSAIGARVVLRQAGSILTRQVEGGTSSHSQQNSPIVHFGLGKAGKPESLEVQWPTGRVQFVKKLDLNKVVVIEEPTSPLPRVKGVKISPESSKGGDKIEFVVDAAPPAKGTPIVKYEWDWTSDNRFDEEANKKTATHVFDQPGKYHVRVRVHDKTGSAVDFGPVVVDVGKAEEAGTPGK